MNPQPLIAIGLSIDGAYAFHNSPHREAMYRILSDEEGLWAIKRLLAVTDNEYLTIGLLRLAAMPPENFIGTLTPEDKAIGISAIAKAVRQAENLRYSLERLDPRFLQSKADTLTNFSRTGHSYDCAVLKKDILDCLAFFIDIGNAEESQPVTDFITRKWPKDERGKALLKARILKWEFDRNGVVTGENHKVIASLINSAMQLSDPLDRKDVEKA